MAQAAHKICEICMRAPGLHDCTQCDQVFCDDCKMSHLRSKISRNHTFMSGPNIKLQREISKYLDSKVDNIRSSAKLIEGKAKTYKTEVEATVKGIIEQGNFIKTMVDEKVDALIKALRERERIELQSLSKASTDLLGEATRHQQIYQDMIKQCDEVALFHKMKKIKSDIDNLKTVDVTNFPSATYNRKSVNFSDVEKLFGNLTFRETKVIGETAQLLAGFRDQLQQIRQQNKKYQSPISSELHTLILPDREAEEIEEIQGYFLREELEELKKKH